MSGDKSQRIDLTKWFDTIDLGVDSIGDWSEYEAVFAEQEFHRIAQDSNNQGMDFSFIPR